MTRYWFNEARNEVFALDIPPPDAGDCLELSKADYEEVVASMAPAPVTEAPVRVSPPATAAEAMSIDMEKLARIWRKMQDARDGLKAKYEAEDAAIKVQQEQVSAVLLDAMNKMGGTSLKTAAGIIEKKQQLQVSGADWDAIYRFIAENDAWELLHKRIGSKFVEDYAKAHKGAVPPGVNVFTKFVVSVKKPGSKEPPKED